MGDLSDSSSLGQISFTVFNIREFTDMASNTAVPERESVEFR